jgi:hypothetical protein
MTIGQNFNGVHYGSLNTDSGALPPDCNGTIGPNHFVQFVNGIFAVYNKTNGVRVQIETDLDFWASAQVSIDTSEWDVTDPRVIYDSTSQRWFASQVDVDVLEQEFNNDLGSNQFLLAVSLTSDPTGQWQGVMFDSDPDNGNFADFPTLGVDSVGLYISGDMFDASGDPTTAAPLGPTLVAIPKVDMLAATPTNGPDISRRTWFGIMSYAQRGQVLQPASCSDGSTQGSILTVDNIGMDSSPHSNVVTWAVQNVVSSGAATLTPAIFTPTVPWEVPDNAEAGAPLLTPTQPDGTMQLQANDARISARVYALSGVLYAVQNTELNNRIAIKYYRMRAADGVLLESATISDTNLDLFFPSIAANSNGTVVIGYDGCSSNTYITAYAVAGQIINGSTAFGTPLVLRASAVVYHGDDETYAQLLGGPVLSRWGDYSATSVDPVNPNLFWTAQMWASDTDVWDTVITELITTPQENMNISVASGAVTLSWPTLLSGYHLQSSTSLGPAASWSNVTQTPATNGAVLSVQLPMVGSKSFFRLEPP